MPETPEAATQPAPQGRSHRRRNVVGSSPNRDEYIRLLEAGWSSLTLERYAAYRYGEDIPAKTIRDYRAKKGIVVAVKPFDRVTADQTVDVVGARAELIRLQQARIAIDWAHEQKMSKLFTGNRAEILLLSTLLSDHKGDLQDLGLMPKAGEKVEFTIPAKPSVEDVPRALTLGALFGAPDADPIAVAGMGRALHLATKAGVAVRQEAS